MPANRHIHSAARPRPRYVLALGFAAMLLLMIALTLIGLAYMKATQERLDAIVANHMHKTDLAMHMYRAARERTVSMQGMLLLDDPFARDEQWIAWDEEATKFIEARSTLMAMGLSEEERALIEEQRRLSAMAVPLQREVVNLISENRAKEAHDRLVNKAIPAQDRVLEVLSRLYKFQERAAEAAAERANREYHKALLWTVALSTTIICLGLIIAVTVMRSSRKAGIDLHQEKERAQVTLHSIGDAVVRTDSSGTIEYVNPVAERLTGWRSADAKGRPFAHVFHIVHGASRAPAPDPVALALTGAGPEASADDLVLLTKDGKEHAVELTANPVRDHAGRVVGVVLVGRDVTEVRALSREVRYRATHDTMTGLLNRAEFERNLQNALAAARMAGSVYTLCYLDLDLFKVVNDSCGHLAGDELLRQLGGVLRQGVRSDDVVARLGGDEFAILLKDCLPEPAAEVADKIRKAICEYRFVWDDKSFQVGVSIGLIRVAPDSGGLKDVLRAADVACQTAKDQGRNRVHLLKPDDATVDRRQREIDWAEQISRAISDDRLVLYGQWVVPLAADLLSESHCEILLRMNGDGGDLVLPTTFLPAAERYHLMPTIDRWVVRHALAALADVDWDTVRTFGCFNINLSGQSLCDREFLSFILRQLARSGVPGRRLCFEITETAAVSNLSNAIELISTLKDAGCQFALDDFGSGLSSFNYLKNMQVDFLKIDGAFVRNIDSDPTDFAMIKSINQVAHSMGIDTVAEYVENTTIQKLLAELGVDYGQGFAIAKPCPLSDILQTLAQSSIDGEAENEF